MVKNPNDPAELDRRDGLSSKELFFVAGCVKFCRARFRYAHAHGSLPPNELKRARALYVTAEKELGTERCNALERRLTEMAQVISRELTNVDAVQGQRRRKKQRMYKTE